MTLHLWFAFLGATVLLMAIPGPNVALIVANSVRYGVRAGLSTVLGTALASLVQLGLSGLGLALALSRFGGLMADIRWLGAAYLVVLGLRHWRATPTNLTVVGVDRPRGLALRAGAVALANPKTLLFFGAFLPQFLDAHAAAGPQLAVLAATYLAVALLMDSGWALLAHRGRALLARRAMWRNRITGGVLIAAGAGLALARSS